MKKRYLLFASVASVILLAAFWGYGVLLPVQAAPSGQQVIALAPHVIETAPLSGEEIPLEADITFYFDQPMDPVSIAAALTVDPPTAGAWTFPDETTASFTPEKPLSRGTTYTFTLGTAATSVDDVPLLEPFDLRVNTVGYLTVAEVLPAASASFVESDTAITVIFNRPVVPLVVAEEMDTLPDPLVITPAVAGTGEWLNTSIYVFQPEALAGATLYTATVSGGLTDVTGGILAEDYTWSFMTTPPAILSMTPEQDAVGVVLETPVRVTFNQAMDRASTEESFILAEQTGTQIEGTFVWTDDDTELTFTPVAGLRLDQYYTAQVDAAFARAANGTVPLESSLVWNFTSVGLPRITGTDPADGITHDPWGGFSIYFASPMDEDSLVGKVIIEPAPAVEPELNFYTYDNRYDLLFPLEPSTDYTVTILPGMADIYGNIIEFGQTVRFNTSGYEPDVDLQVPGYVGVYSAYAPQTQLFATHMNASQLDVELYEANLDLLMRLTGPNSYEMQDRSRQVNKELTRRWTVPVEQVPNQWRYELLTISTVGENVPLTCAGAPEPRLTMGGTATVITEPDPLRARQGSPSGEIVDLLYKDYQLAVVGGPLCMNGYFWWQVQLRDGQQAWVAEGDTTEYYLDPGEEAVAPPPVEPIEIETGSVGGAEALAPGIYQISLTSPETLAEGRFPRWHTMVVATANVTLKNSIDSMLAWVTDMDSGQPLAGVPVTFYGEDYQPVASAVTDADGLATASLPRLDGVDTYLWAVINTPTDFGFTAGHWAEGIRPYNFNLPTDFDPQETMVYLYSDRPIYRPGQTVYFRGVARAQDDVTYTPAPFKDILIRINGRGEMLHEEVLPLTEYGSFSGQFELDDDADLGHYEITTVLERDDPEAYNRSDAWLGFNVAEYRVPEFQVTVMPEVDQTVQGETIPVLIEGAYFFGGPVANAEVSYTVQSQDYYFRYDGLERYDFVDYDYDSGPSAYYGGYGYGSIVAEGVGETDDQGRLLIEVPADLGENTQSQTLTIEASIVDESDQYVYNRTEVVVHQGEVYVGLRPEKYVGQAGEENVIHLTAVDWDSVGVAGQEIAVEVVERRWSSVQEEDDYGRTTWTWEVEEIPVEGAAGSVAMDAEGRGTFTFVPPAAGTYKAYATTRDDLGNEVRSSTYMWVSGPQYVAWRQQNSNRIDLIMDRDSYKVGDMAEVLIASPWQGDAMALVTIERGDVLHHEVIPLTTNSTVYRFPIEDAYAPNVFVSVLLVKGVDENTAVAEFRLGMAQITVDPERREISVSVTPDREQAGPRETVTYTVETVDYAGNPVQAEVGLGLTDLAVLSIADPNSRPLMQHFYGEQGLSIRTAIPLTISTDQLTQEVLDTIKGGGGGGGGDFGIFEVRQEFIDTPYWNPILVTGEDGTATIDVTLPDNLTTWRMDARAVTDGRNGITLVGQTEQDLISTKPLLLRPITPRFFVVGDDVTLVAIVNNNTGETMSVEASLQGSGVVFNGDQDITAEVAAGARQRFEWPVTVEDGEAVDLTFYANGNDGAFTDASKPPTGQGDDRLLPVYKYEVPETVGTGGMIEAPGTVTEAISLPRQWAVTQGELTVRVEPSLAAGTVDGLDYLRNFPHQCIEQTVSRFLPNVMTYRALQSLGLDDAELRENLEREVSFGLQRLYAQQHSDGGWGWFVTSPSNTLTTAYALIGLTEAQGAGFAVSNDVIMRAVAFLNGELAIVNINTPDYVLNRQAFILYALARAERGNVARTMNLFEYREKLSRYAQAYLAVALNRMALDMGDEIDSLVASLVSDAVLSATGAHWEEDWVDAWNWNTDSRTTAIVLGALIELEPDNDLLAQAVRWLMVTRTADHWETTQETAWALMALTDWMVTTGELEPAYLMQVILNDGELLAEQATVANADEAYILQVEVAELLTDAPNLLELTHGDGPGVMYYTAHLRAFLPVPEVEPLNRGIILDRRYSLMADSDRTPITAALVGEAVRVTLTIIVPNALHYVVIEDPIPAGSDAVDPGLNTSQQIGTRPEVDQTDPLSRGWGWWYFSRTEFRDEKVVIYADYLPPGTYEYSYVIRTGLPGEYNVIPTTGQEFYFPEVYGRGGGSLFTITPEVEE